MKTYIAREINEWDFDDLWFKEEEKEKIKLVFDNGEIITTWPQTIISWFFWAYHRKFPKTPLKVHSHVNGEYFSPSLQQKLLENGKADVRSAYPNSDDEDLNLIAYQITNECHNFTVGELEAYAGTLDALAFLQIHEDPSIQSIRQRIVDKPSKAMVNMIYRDIRDTLMKDSAYNKNPIAISLKQGTVKQGQLLQIIGMRGYCSEINQRIFKKIIPVGFMDGLTRASFFAMESRSASTALLSAEDPVRSTEYYNRELQLLNYNITEIDFEDCGSHETIPWEVTENDIKHGLVGKYHMVNHQPVVILKQDRHLIGTVIDLRTPLYCHHSDESVVCKYCLGEVSHSFQRNANAQYQAIVEQNESVSQGTISVKHLLMSAESDFYSLEPEYQFFLDNSANDKDIALSPELWRNNRIELSFAQEDIFQLSEILGRPKLDDCDVYKLTKINQVLVSYQGIDDIVPRVGLIPLAKGSYAPYLTLEFLNYIRDHGYSMVDRKIVVSLDHWPGEEIIFRLPQRRSTVLESAEQLKRVVFASGESSEVKQWLKQDLRDPQTLAKSLLYIFNLTNARFHVSLPIIELMMLSMSARDPDNGDYRIPRKGTGAKFAKQTDLMKHRSLSAKAAYERQSEMSALPSSYLQEDRTYYPFDELLVPTGKRHGYKSS